MVVQTPSVRADGFNYWARSYGGSGTDVINDVKVLPDGSIIAVGYTTSSGAGGKDVLVMKLSPEGGIAWAKTYGGTKDDVANAVAIADNGDVIVAGWTGSFGAGDYDVWVLHLDSNGNVKWQKTYGGSDYDEANAVALASNGDIIVAGWTGSFGAGGGVWVLRLDANGNVKWQKTYREEYWNNANAVVIADNGDVIVAGHYGGDAWVLRLPPDGDLPGFSRDSNAKITIPSPDVRDSKAAVEDSGVTPKDSHAYPNPAELTVKTQYGPALPAFTILSVPPGANVYINGTYEGVTPLTLNLTPGTYEVKLIKKGYENYTTTVTINPGQTTVINAQLTPQPASLTINSNPSGAKVYVDGDYRGTTPLTLNLTPGTHSIKLTKQDYQDYTTTITLNPGESKTISVTLTPAFGYLSVDSSPAGAKVYVDGSYIGDTPIENYKLSIGQHSLKITKQGYQDYTTTIILNPGDSKTLNIELTPIFGYLTINSNPSGATVFIDGTKIGKTPIEKHKILTGTHRVLVKMNGYHEESFNVLIQSNKELSFNVELIPLPGTLTINSNPSGAKVYVDGDYRGTTPLTLNLTPGTHSIKLTKQDYEDYTTSVTLNPGESKTISATLTPAFGYLSVDSSPSGAKVYVDGDYAGETPLKDYKLPTGEHEIKIVKDGYQNFTKTVTISPGEKASVAASLVQIKQHQTTTTPVQTTSSPRTTTSPSTTSTPSSSSPTTSSSPPTTSIPPTQTAQATAGGGIPKTYIIAGLLVLGLLGGVAAKARGGKPKPGGGNIPGFPPELLNKYEPLEFLGEGGFAKVYKVKRRSDGKIIALKVPNLDERARKFFLKEIRAWRLLDHPNIVKLYNAYDEPVPHLEIEFVDGVKLNGEVIRDLGRYPKPVDEEKALNFIKGIAEGLKHAHGKQVYHRDLKPQNVLITSDLTPKITDWGLAKVGAVSTTATTTKGLTLLYAAPEQLDEEEYGHTDARTDIYQLGLIFYELLTGKLPYQGTSPAVMMAKVINPDVKPKPPSHFDKALAKYDGIFEKLLAKRKEDRYQSVDEFLNDLELMRKLDEERRELEKTVEKTKTTMSLTTDSRELRKLRRQVVEQLSSLALLHAQLNDKAELINALEDLKAFSKENREEIENAIGQFELMMRESVPISKSTLDELKVLLHKVQREVEG